MSHVSQTVRPFLGLGPLTDLFETSSVYFGLDRCPANETIVLEVDPDEYARRSVVLQWTTPKGFDAFRERLFAVPNLIEMPQDALCVIATASTSYLKQSEVVLNFNLADKPLLTPEEPLSNQHRAKAFLTGHHGCSIDLYLALNRDLKPNALRPWRKGTWLTHNRFRIQTTHERPVFRPTPLTDQRRAELGLGRRSLRYFDLGDHDPLRPYDDQVESPAFYVDEHLLAELRANSNTTASHLIQLQLVLDFVAGVFHASAQRIDDLSGASYEDLETSLLGRVIRICAGPGATMNDRQNLVTLVRDNPARAVARAEHTIDLHRTMMRLFHESAR